MKAPAPGVADRTRLGSLARSDLKPFGTEDQMARILLRGRFSHLIDQFVKKRVRQQLSQRRGQKRQQAYSASDDAEPV